MAEPVPPKAPRRGLWKTLRARFDGAALQVALPGQPAHATRLPTAGQAKRWGALHDWCFRDAGEGRSPLLQPTRAPAVGQRLTVAVWSAQAMGCDTDLVEAFCRHLDGSHRLLGAGGSTAQTLLRLRMKANDVAWWRRRRTTDPWDCGYVLHEPARCAALARFEPRRATLMVSVDWPANALNEALLTMARSSRQFLHPVRWLVVLRGPDATDGITRCLRSTGLPVEQLQPRAEEA